MISTYYDFFTFVLYFCVILQRVFVQLEICENKYSSIVQGLAVKSFCWENGAFILNNCSWRQMVDIWCMYVQCASSVTNLYLYFGKIFQLPEIEIIRKYLLHTQGGKDNSEGKKVQQSLTSKLSIGMFIWFKIVKIKRIHEAILEGWWYTGRIIHQLWAEWAVCVNCYLQNGFVNFFVFYNFESI